MPSLLKSILSALIVALCAALVSTNALAKSPSSYYVVVAGKKIPNLSRDSDEWWHILTGNKHYKAGTECPNGSIVIERNFKTDAARDGIIAKLNQGRWDVKCAGDGGLLYKAKTLSCDGGVGGDLGKRIRCTFKP